MSTGEEVKTELKRLISLGKNKTALQIARESLKECQNFIKEFKPTSDFHLKIEKAMSDLNNLIVDVSGQTEKKQEESNKEAETQNEKKYFKTKILSEEIRENATKIAETSINFEDFPKTAYGFEKAFNSMKNREDLFYGYLKYLDPNILPNLYQSSEISYNILIGIIQTLTKFTLDNEDAANLTLKYLFNLSKTKNFALLKKFFKKSEKENLKNVFNLLKEKYGHVVSTYGVDFEKLYF